MASLAEIRARIAAQENKSNSGSTTQSDNAIYPHWNMDEGTSATIRFLPDGNSTNTFFWVERQIIKLPFNGVKGDSAVKQIQVQVPCPIRRFIISPQIFTIIKSSLMDPEMEEMPTDYVRGLDFRVTKTSKGGYADYSTSTWSRKESALTQAEQDAIQAHGLFNLADFLPKKPSEAELRIIKEMFEASVDGRPYDPDRWGAYYRPYGLDVPAGAKVEEQATAVQATAATTAPVAEPAPWDDEPETASQPVKVPTTPTSDKAQDILAMIRARQNKAA